MDTTTERLGALDVQKKEPSRFPDFQTYVVDRLDHLTDAAGTLSQQDLEMNSKLVEVTTKLSQLKGDVVLVGVELAKFRVRVDDQFRVLGGYVGDQLTTF